tara:strand:- start:5083 stop:5244 length:162 start_codon:yes stop_codon:yes gene_type:complete
MSARSRFEHNIKVKRRIRKAQWITNYKLESNNLTDLEKQNKMLEWAKFIKDVQ